MFFSIGDKITTKKPHACGGNEWVVIRTGADIKIKCSKCERIVMLTPDEVKKIAKKVEKGQ